MITGSRSGAKQDENPQEPEDTDIPETPDETPDETPETPDETPVNPEAAENHKISGILQAGSSVSGIHAALAECGKTEELASANTDAKGKFSFNADIRLPKPTA